MRKSTGTELFLLAVVGLCAISLVAARFFSPIKGLALSVYNDGEKTRYEDSQLYIKTFEVGIRLSDKDAILLLNGEACAPKTNGGNEYEIVCCEKDVFEMDLRACGDKDVTAYVFEADSNLATPVVGTKLVGRGGITMLFKVYLK